MTRWAALFAALHLMACSAGWHLERGEAALEAMELVEAERAFRTALAREPDMVEALYGLGWTYHLAGHREEARETFERCTQVAPERELGFKGLGSIALAEGNLDIARARFEQALQRSPDDPSVRNSIALLHIRAERYDEALEVYDGLQALQLQQPELAIGRAEVLLRTGRLDEARRAVDQGLESDALRGRHATLLHVLRARILHANTTGRLDQERCGETAPPLLAWLDEADRSLERAEAQGLQLESLPSVRREVHQRRKLIQRTCPDVDELGGEGRKTFPID
jgi:tetratricopeptide (TPR) repeat protein